MANYWERKYATGTDEFRCDNFVEASLIDAGLIPTDYLSGRAISKSVQDHIDHAVKMKHTVKQKKNNAPSLGFGIYIVFMNESYKVNENGTPLSPHTGIILVKSDGSVEYTDNSSGNENEGVETSMYESVQKFQTAYAYNSFYYQQVVVEEDSDFDVKKLPSEYIEQMGL